MRIPTNKIASVAKYYKTELATIYDPGEIEQFIRISIDEILHINPTIALQTPEQRVNESALIRFSQTVKRLKKQEPIQYIFGQTEFYGLSIAVSPAVLIPRPETEELVDWIIQDHREASQANLQILDICTGCGCIALALANQFKYAKVSGWDISAEALAVAQNNATKLHLDVQFSLTDILKDIPSTLSNEVSILVSNPPYVLEKEKEAMHANVLQHEPHLALFVPDQEPLLFYKRLGEIGLQLLKQGGNIYVEINQAMGEQVVSLFQQQGYVQVTLRSDINGRNRMVKAVKR